MKIISTNNYVGTISRIDSDLLEMEWKYSGKYFYRTHNGKTTSLHRVILERMVGRALTRKDFTDHKDRNTLNNKRTNLRLSSNAQNQQNQRLRIDNKSGYRNINLYKGKWNISIRINGKKKYFGRFATIEEAKQARDKIVKEKFGQFASID